MTANLRKSAGPDSPFADHASRFAAGRMGMLIFLVSLGVLFAASLVGYFVIRFQPYVMEGAPAWPDDLPSLPRILLLSTFVLALSSAAMQSALNGICGNSTFKLKWFMLATVLLGAVFLVLQIVAWVGWLEQLGARAEREEPYQWALVSFYVLTGVHAAHVIGGLVPMAFVTLNAWRGVYSSAYYPGVFYNTLYWHFLGVVWVILYLTLYVGT